MRASLEICLCFVISTSSQPSSPSALTSSIDFTSTSGGNERKLRRSDGGEGRVTNGLEKAVQKANPSSRPAPLWRHLNSSSKPNLNWPSRDPIYQIKQGVFVFSHQMDKNKKKQGPSDPPILPKQRDKITRTRAEDLMRSAEDLMHYEDLMRSAADRMRSPRIRPTKVAKLTSTESNKLYFFFWHAYSPVMYSIYEVPMPLLHPPSKDDKRLNPKSLNPIIELKTGKYPDGMCCVQLDSVLYFLGGEMNFDNPYIGEDAKKEPVEKVKGDVFPRDVYFFHLNAAAIDLNLTIFGEDKDLAVSPISMNSGKANPLAFVVEEKIYVIGSTHQDLDENFPYFEMFDPELNDWFILPNPPIRNVNTIWVAHVVVGRKALIVAWQQEKERLYCFHLDTHKWSNTVIPDYLGNLSGNTEFVGKTIYGCYHDTVAAIAPSEEEEEEEEVAAIAPSEEEEEEEEEVDAIAPSEEEEEEVEAEENELQQLFKHHCLHQVSEEMGMDAILNVPPQVQYSSGLLHLRNKYFCYVRTGMPPHPDPDLASDLVIGDDKKRFISIVIFQAGGRATYKKDDTRFFKANFIRSEHYEINTTFPNEGFMKGCYYLSSGYPESSKQISV